MKTGEERGGKGENDRAWMKPKLLLKTANYFPNLRGRAREGAASVG